MGLAILAAAGEGLLVAARRLLETADLVERVPEIEIGLGVVGRSAIA